jgi:hypothetical protein
MGRATIWFLVGIALAWGLFRWWTNPSTPIAPKGPTYAESVNKAKQDHMDHVASVLWRQSLALKDTVPLVLNNRSGMEVYVKVVSLDIKSAEMAVNVPNGSKVQVECPLGRFFLKMRYKSEKGYTYQKGDDFSLDKGSTTEITLHKVPMGNYGSSSMAPSEF